MKKVCLLISYFFQFSYVALKKQTKKTPGGFVCVMQTETHAFCFDDKSLVVGKTGFRESDRTKALQDFDSLNDVQGPFSCLDSPQLCSEQEVWGRPASCQPQQMWQSETTRKCRMFECEMTQICNRTLPRLWIHGWFWMHFWMSLGSTIADVCILCGKNARSISSSICKYK